MKTLKAFKFTLLCIALIFYLCFFTPPKTDLDQISNFDKFVHMAMYAGTLGIFWIEYWRLFPFRRVWSRLKLALLAVVCPILMSGIIEILQAYCTGGRRSGDWRDFAANSVGVFLALLLGNTIIKTLVMKHYKGSK